MNRPACWILVAVCMTVGCSGPSGPSPETIGKQTREYWNKCLAINEQYVADKRATWFKGFRPGAVGEIYRKAATQLREIDNTGVDAEVIDHVNRVIRGLEQMGAAVETKDKNWPWWVLSPGLPPMAPVLYGGDDQDKTFDIAKQLIESEERAIRHVRQVYGIELRPCCPW